MIEIRSPKTDQEWTEYYDLRYRVMREPLGKTRGSERNEGDSTAQHFALFNDQKIQAIARLDKIDNNQCQIRFVAVESNLQGSGFGKKIMLAVENEAKSQNFKKIILHARDYAIPFYKKLGYIEVGPSYKLFDVLQHFEFFKNL